MATPVKKFRINAASVFLTYSQCYIPSKEDVLALLRAWETQHVSKIDQYLIAMEAHEDGGIHYHVWLKFSEKLNLHSPDAFDLLWEDAVYHPNIGTCRNDGAVRRYCVKDDDYICNYSFNSVWKRLRDESDSVEAGMKLLAQEDPRSYFMYGDRIEANLRRLHKPAAKVYEDPNGPDAVYKPPRVCSDWVEFELNGDHRRRKCLIIIGKTKLGKTDWARSLGKHVFFRGTWSLEMMDPDAKYMVFDDIAWEFIPYKKQLLTDMGDCILTDKFLKKIPICVTCPSIVLLNKDDINPEKDPRSSEYWSENAVCVEVFDKFY